MNDSKRKDEAIDVRRWMLLLIAVGLGIACFLLWWFGDTGTQLYAAALGRISLVLGAVWLALPSLRRPARWLPPGMAVGGVILLAVLAAQPRLVVVAIPAFMALLTVAAVARTFKR